MLYNRKSVVTITPPVGLAVTLASVKAQLVIEGSDDDAMLTEFMTAATAAAQEYMKVAIQTQTLELRMDGFTGRDYDDGIARLGPGVHEVSAAWMLGGTDYIELPFGPVQSVTSITTWDRANNPAVFDAGAYTLDGAGWRVHLNEGRTWPSELRRFQAVAVRYVAGYGATVPAPILQEIRQHVAAMYECRSGCDIPDACRALLAPYRRLEVW